VVYVTHSDQAFWAALQRFPIHFISGGFASSFVFEYLLLQSLSALRYGLGILAARVSTVRALMIGKAASSAVTTESFILKTG
jgi:hypothetical protein